MRLRLKLEFQLLGSHLFTCSIKTRVGNLVWLLSSREDETSQCLSVFQFQKILVLFERLLFNNFSLLFCAQPILFFSFNNKTRGKKSRELVYTYKSRANWAHFPS